MQTSGVRNTSPINADRRAYQENIERIDSVGLLRRGYALYAFSVAGMLTLGSSFALTGMSRFPIACVVIAACSSFWIARLAIAKPLSYGESVAITVHSNLGIVGGVLVSLSTYVDFVKLVWLIGVVSFVYSTASPLTTRLQQFMVFGVLGVALAKGLRRGDVPDWLAVAGVATASVVNVVLWHLFIAIRRRLFAHSEALEALARVDPLTGVCNRRGLLAADLTLGPSTVAALVDLDGFKCVNDTMGHAAGDHLLKRTAVELQAICGPNAVVARLGGDEFGVVGADLPADIGSRLNYALQDLSVTASVGYAAAGEELKTIGELLKEADRMMYSTKRATRDVGPSGPPAQEPPSQS